MSRKFVMDSTLERHEVASCDVCAVERTIDVCIAKQWILGRFADVCDLCKLRDPKATARVLRGGK